MDKENMLLDNLNAEQKAAILVTNNYVRIIAGAGSGKTRVLTRKIAYLIDKMNIKPWKILALTFTNKAANEMKERVYQLIGDEANSTNISTFHSLCSKILRIEIRNLNEYNNNFIILDSIDQIDILKSIYKKYEINSNDISYYSMLEYISHIKNDFENKEISIEKDTEFEELKHTIYLDYNEELKKSNSLDFDDLLLFVNKIFIEHPDIANKWQDKFEYILVDEFQDTSKIQYEILKHLSKKANMTIVGDPDQTIYTWRGADISLINDFDKNHPNVETITLNKNYRSTKNILIVANNLIKHNVNRIYKELTTDNVEGSQVDYYNGLSQELEIRWVISKIKELKNSGNNLNDMVILYRSNFYSREIENQLIYNAIPHKIFGGQKFFERAEIKDCIAYLRTIFEPQDISLKRIINVPNRKIGLTTIDKLVAFSENNGISLWETINRHLDQIEISSISKANLNEFIEIINKYKKALEKESISSILKSLLNDINYYEYIKKDNQARVENVDELIESIKKWETQNSNKTLVDYLEDVSLLSLNEDKNNSDCLTLMTIHASKGLEFDNVFIVGMNENIFPTSKSLEKENFEILEEERRLAYVAITRAKKNLFVSSSGGMFFDNKTPKLPSRFLSEMGIQKSTFSPISFTTNHFEKKTNLDDFLNKEVSDFNSGDHVLHSNFGKGVVLDINGDTITIEFEKIGMKQLLKNHKSIKKV